MSVVVAGAGHAAVQLAATLRQGGFDAPITLVAGEPSPPCQRPPLSKAYLAGAMDEAALALRPERFYGEQRIALIAGDPATGIDRAGRTLRLASGRALPYDHLVLATGAANRPLAMPGADLPGVVGLRSLEEARALRDRLPTLRRVAVIGAGFIGLEFAAIAAARGIATTVIEAAARPLARSVSAPMAAHIADTHRAWGTRLLPQTGVRAIRAAPDGLVVETGDGDAGPVPADLVLVAVGVVPNTALAATAGLATANGIMVDAYLRTEDPRISAIGDCAAFPLPGLPVPVRLESVQNALDQARCVAERLLGRAAAYAKLPWFWSDQGPLKLQIAGLSAGHDQCVRRGDAGAFSIFCFLAGRLVAVESLNRPADHMLARKLLAAGTTLVPEQVADPGTDLRRLG